MAKEGDLEFENVKSLTLDELKVNEEESQEMGIEKVLVNIDTLTFLMDFVA